MQMELGIEAKEVVAAYIMEGMGRYRISAKNRIDSIWVLAFICHWGFGI